MAQRDPSQLAENGGNSLIVRYPSSACEVGKEKRASDVAVLEHSHQVIEREPSPHGEIVSGTARELAGVVDHAGGIAVLLSKGENRKVDLVDIVGIWWAGFHRELHGGRLAEVGPGVKTLCAVVRRADLTVQCGCTGSVSAVKACRIIEGRSQECQNRERRSARELEQFLADQSSFES